VNLRENGPQREGQTFFAVWPYRILFLYQKRRKNIITRFKEHSPNKYHGLSLVYIHITCTTSIMEEYNSVSKHTYVYRVLVGKPEGKRPLGKDKSRWLDNIEMHFIN
jgi:hypothetical protein